MESNIPKHCEHSFQQTRDQLPDVGYILDGYMAKKGQELALFQKVTSMGGHT